MKEYTATVKAEPMSATEAMKRGIEVRNPYNNTGGSEGYLIHYPDGHKLWLNEGKFNEQYKTK